MLDRRVGLERQRTWEERRHMDRHGVFCSGMVSTFDSLQCWRLSPISLNPSSSPPGQPKFPYKQNWLEPQAGSTFTPQSKVRRALAESWKSVDPSSLDAETRTAVENLESGKRRDWLARREKVKVENLSVKDLKGLEAWRRKQEQRV